MQTILGANGVIGKELAAGLTAYTNEIRLVSRNPKAVNKGDQLMAADLTLPLQVDKAVEGSDIVYLTVGLAYNFKIWRQQWPLIMHNVIESCKKYGAKLVFFDNVYMYDPEYMGNMTEETPIRPVSKKGEVRSLIAALLMEEIKSGNLTALIARSADFIGPANSFLVESVYKNLNKGKKANWFSRTDKIHSFTNTTDAAKGTAMLGNTPDAYGEVWHLPTSDALLTGKDWVGLFAREMNAKAKLSALPDGMLTLLGLFIPILKELKEMTYQYNRDYFFNSNKFNQRFGYKPLSPEESVKNLVAVLRHSS